MKDVIQSNNQCTGVVVVVVVVDDDQISIIISYIFINNIRFSGALYSEEYTLKTTEN